MTRPAVFVAGLFVLGIYIERLLGFSFYLLCISCILLLICCILNRRKAILSSASCLIAIIFLGAIFYKNTQTYPASHIKNFTPPFWDKPLHNNVEHLNGYKIRTAKTVAPLIDSIFAKRTGQAPAAKETAVLRGVIVSDPVFDATDYGAKKFSCIVSASKLRLGNMWNKVSGLVSVAIFADDIPYRYGDEVVLEGVLSGPKPATNPGQFDYRQYLYNKSIYSVFGVKEQHGHILVGNQANPILKFCYKIRERARNALNMYLSPDVSSLMSAILIGDRSNIEYDLKDDFIKTGTVHILAISGLHIGIIGAILFAIFTVLRIPRNARYILTIIALAVYTLMTGANAPVVRSFVMLSIFFIGMLLKREPDILNSLAVAAFLILLFKPNQLFDAGFQLSFVSVGSIIYLNPKIYPVIKRFINNRYISKTVSVSVSAWFGVFPVVLYYFNIVSFVALIANVIIVPWLGIVVASGITFVSVWFLFKPGVFIFANSASFISLILIKIASIFSSVPYGSMRLPKPSLLMIAVYYALLFVIAEHKRLKIYKSKLLMLVLALANIFVWQQVFAKKADSVKITFLDVGHGDSMFIEFPHNSTMLIDGGSSLGRDAGRSIIAPFLWNKGITRIDAVVLTHPEEDHIGGLLYVLNNFDVGLCIDNGMPQRHTSAYKEYLKAIEKRQMDRVVVRGDYIIEGFADSKLQVLHPSKQLLQDTGDDSNNNSIVLKLNYKNKSVLFCGDIEEEGLKVLLRKKDALKSDVLKTPHHGSALGDIGREFFNIVSPKIAVISVGGDNLRNLPHQATLEALKDSGTSIYTTSEHGAIEIRL